jgi:Rrf2 family nitric oxide-sensitive transcriptional repressor
MRLTSFTNYALRTLQLAALRAPALVRVDDVVKVHGLARPHIVKIVHELGKAGFIETQRGRGGGFRLARDPAQITVGEVVRLTEGPFDLVECFNRATNTCPLIGICKLSSTFAQATRVFLDVLDGVTVADIASNRDALLGRIAPLQAGIVSPIRTAV